MEYSPCRAAATPCTFSRSGRCLRGTSSSVRAWALPSRIMRGTGSSWVRRASSSGGVQCASAYRASASDMCATTASVAEFAATVSAVSVVPASAVLAAPAMVVKYIALALALPYVEAAAAVYTATTQGVEYTVPVPDAFETLASAVCAAPALVVELQLAQSQLLYNSCCEQQRHCGVISLTAAASSKGVAAPLSSTAVGSSRDVAASSPLPRLPRWSAKSPSFLRRWILSQRLRSPWLLSQRLPPSSKHRQWRQKSPFLRNQRASWRSPHRWKSIGGT